MSGFIYFGVEIRIRIFRIRAKNSVPRKGDYWEEVASGDYVMEGKKGLGFLVQVYPS